MIDATKPGIAAVGVLLATAVFATAGAQQPSSTLPHSAGDPPAFYTWRGEVPKSAGQLLRKEPLEQRLRLEKSSDAVRFLYSSESFSGDPIAVSGAAFLPRGDPPTGGWPVIAWSHGTVGIADLCAPSWRGRSPRDVSYLNFWLENGYAIVATDYEGLGTPGPHPYLHCKAAGLGNIDAVAAARALGWPLSKKWIVAGQSQGGHGALCTGAYADERGNGVEFLGTLATAPGVSFLEAYSGEHPERDGPMRYLGVVLLNVRGMETFTPTFSAEVALTEKARSLMHRVDETCVGELLEEGARLGLRTSTTFKTMPFSETPGVRDAVVHMEIPAGALPDPVLIGQGTEDSMTALPLANAYAKELCDAGTALTYLVYPGEEHSGPMNVGRTDFLKWAKGRFGGTDSSGNCEELPGTASGS